MLTLSSISSWVLLGFAAFTIGISKTALPGAATLAVAIFAAILPARDSTGTMLILLLVGDILAIRTYWRDAEWTVLKRLVPGVLIGVGLGTLFLRFASDTTTKRFIGTLLLILIATTLTLMRLPNPPTIQGPIGRAVYGTLAGFTTMAANAGGPVTSMYFLASRFTVSTFLGTTAWFFFIVNLIKLPISIGLGIIRSDTLLIDLILAPIVITSALVGRRLAQRMDEKIFGPIVTVLTIISSLHLLA